MSDRNRQPLSIPVARSLSRRASLFGIGSAALAAAVVPTASRAGKAGKKAKKVCKRQIGQCQASVSDFCANPQLVISQAECEVAFLPCCLSFKSCKAGAVYDCMGDALLTLIPPETPV